MYALVSGFAFMDSVSFIPLVLLNDDTLERQFGSNLSCFLNDFFDAEEGEKADEEKKVDGENGPGHE